MSKQKKYFNLNLPVLLFAMSCSVMRVMFCYELSSRESPRLYISDSYTSKLLGTMARQCTNQTNIPQSYFVLSSHAVVITSGNS